MVIWTQALRVAPTPANFAASVCKWTPEMGLFFIRIFSICRTQIPPTENASPGHLCGPTPKLSGIPRRFQHILARKKFGTELVWASLTGTRVLANEILRGEGRILCTVLVNVCTVKELLMNTYAVILRHIECYVFAVSSVQSPPNSLNMPPQRYTWTFGHISICYMLQAKR